MWKRLRKALQQWEGAANSGNWTSSCSCSCTSTAAMRNYKSFMQLAASTFMDGKPLNRYIAGT